MEYVSLNLAKQERFKHIRLETRRGLLARPDEEVEEFPVALAVHSGVEGHDLDALGGCLAVDG